MAQMDTTPVAAFATKVFELNYPKLVKEAQALLDEIRTVPLFKEQNVLEKLQKIVSDGSFWSRAGVYAVRILEYTPGVGLVFSLIYCISGKKEEAKAAYIRHTNGAISCAIVMAGVFLPVMGVCASVAAFAALGALGSGLGTALEAMLADVFVKDPDVRATLARLTWADVLTNAFIGAVCGAIAGIIPHFAIDDIMSVMQRSLARAACLGPEILRSVAFGSMDHLDYVAMRAFLIHAKMRVHMHKVTEAKKDYERSPKGSAAWAMAKSQLRNEKEALERCKQEMDKIEYPPDLYVD